MKKIENAERPMSAIVSSPAQRGPCACPADTFQFGDQFVNEAHPAEESTFESRRKREPQHAAGESEENHNLWHFRLSQVRTRPMADIFESVARINYKCDSFAFRTAAPRLSKLAIGRARDSGQARAAAQSRLISR